MYCGTVVSDMDPKWAGLAMNCEMFGLFKFSFSILSKFGYTFCTKVQLCLILQNYEGYYYY